MALWHLIVGTLVGSFAIWQGRRMAESPDRALDVSESLLRRSGMAWILPVRSWTVKLMRYFGVFATWWGVALLLFAVSESFNLSTGVRQMELAVTLVIAFALTPRQKPRTVRDTLWFWQEQREERERWERLRDGMLKSEDLRQRLERPVKHPRRRLRRENAKRRRQD